MYKSILTYDVCMRSIIIYVNLKLTDFSQDVDGPSLPILLEEKGISWKAYLENYPGK